MGNSYDTQTCRPTMHYCWGKGGGGCVWKNKLQNRTKEKHSIVPDCTKFKRTRSEYKTSFAIILSDIKMQK